MTDSDAGRAVCSRKGFGKLKYVNIRFLWTRGAVAKKNVTLKREPRIFQRCRSGTKHFTKERFEALRKMVDMEEIGDRKSVKYVGTITCGEKEALDLAQAKSSLMGVPTAAMVFGLAWMYRSPCKRRRPQPRTTCHQTDEVQLVAGKSRDYVTPSVAYVPYGERYHVQRACLGLNKSPRTPERTPCKRCFSRSPTRSTASSSKET